MNDTLRGRYRRAYRDLVVMFMVAVLVFVLASTFDLFERLPQWTRRYEAWQLDEILTVLLVLSVALGIFSLRRWRELRDELIKRQQTEESLRGTERRLSFLVEQTPLAVIEWDRRGRVTKWNPAAETIFGYREREALGRPAADLIFSPDAGHEMSRKWNELLRQKGGARTTTQNRTRDGRTIVCEWYITPVLSSTGNVMGATSLGHDITERIRAEEALRKSELKFRTLAETTTAAIFITRGTKLGYINPAAELMTGWKQDEALGKQCADVFRLIDGKTRAVTELPLAKMFEEGIVVEVDGQTALISKDGRKIPVDINMAPIRDDEGLITGAVLLFRDISKIQQAEAKLGEMRAQLKKWSQSRARQRSSRRMSREERRQQLLDTAIRVFARKGFGGTTTREIAEEAKVSEPVIFQHFRTKDDLYAAILKYKMRQREVGSLEALEQAARIEDDRAVFKLLASQLIDYYLDDPDFVRFLLYSALERPELSKKFVRQQIKPLYEFLCDYIKQRFHDGAFRQVDPEIAAGGFFGMVHNYALLRALFKKSWRQVQVEQAVDELVGIFIEGTLSR